MTDEDDLVVLDEEHVEKAPQGKPWRLLVVDDEPEVHHVTEIALRNFEFRNRPIEFINANSAAEAREILAREEGIAAILLDVVMESDQAGLELTDYIRNELSNNDVRIILRTGQAGQAPPRDVVRKYDISDYRDKSELTVQKLDTVMCTSFAMYEQVQELRRSNRDLEQFAYVVSHDLQEPLRAVTSFVLLLKKTVADKLDETELEYLQYITEGAERLRDMIHSLLSLSRLTTQAGDYEPVLLDTVITHAMEDLTEAVQESGAEVRYENLPEVKMEPTQAAVLFRNLIGNAIRYGKEGVAPQIDITSQRVDGGWAIKVQDNGIGFDTADSERIFDIFTRLHRSDEFEGTGIGLALCQKIVRRHGGRISAESEVGVGSTFTVFLPENPDA